MKNTARIENLEHVLAQADMLEGRARFAAEVRRQRGPFSIDLLLANPEYSSRSFLMARSGVAGS